jgi:hypothetical protein
MPNTIISFGTKIQVKSVMSRPYEKILNPRPRYFQKSVPPGGCDTTALP